MSMDASAHCAAIVRAGNRDRYLADLFAPEAVRPHLLALHAFDVEVATVRDKVKEPMLGEIRLEWWRQALRGDHGGQPVAAALAETIARFNLPIGAFDNLLQARIFDLYDDPMPTVGDLEGYAGDTASAIIQLTAIILAGGKEPGSAEAAGLAGVALAVTGILANLPASAARGQCYLPADRLAVVGAAPADLRSEPTTEGVRTVFADLAALARERLAAARQAMGALDRAILPAFLPAAVVEPMLNRMTKPAYDPLRDGVDLSPLRRQWITWTAARRGRV
ncbi:phytoene/squalene synthase family protein [Bauldia litoralis]|uniref:phytoene/squalene synthase family protein n=3 Tax=Bauldia litoralis TaxID=665467 RepID=UPI0032634368